ncbi:MAG TPA: diguanylate cyclase [Burkholderiaceae bacterium]|nr:diguanylate cyclase [Burkholderiaceae bacterium]
MTARTLAMRLKVALISGLLTLALAGLAATIASGLLEERRVSQVGRDATQIANEMALGLSQELALRADDLSRLMRQPEFDNLDTPADMRPALNEMRRRAPLVEWVAVADPRGKVIAASDTEHEGGDVSLQMLFQGGRDGLWFGETSTQSTAVAAPHRTSEGTLKAVLLTQMRRDWMEMLERKVLALHGSPSDTQVYVARRDGSLVLGGGDNVTSVATPMQALAEPDAPPWRGIKWPDEDDAVVASAESTRLSDFPGLGWQVVVRTPVRAFMEASTSLRNQLLTAGAGLAVLAAALGWFASGRLLRGARTRALGLMRRKAAAATAAADRRKERPATLAEQRRELDAALARRESQEGELHHVAFHDDLTGLPNRRFLEACVSRLSAKGAAAGEIVTVSLDIDNFREVNARLGHDAGDQLLQAVAQRLRAVLRDGDLALRVGGDEFLLLAEVPPGEAMAATQHFRTRLAGALSAPIRLERGEEASVHIDVGVAVWAPGRVPWTAALAQADSELQALKRGRRRASA